LNCIARNPAALASDLAEKLGYQKAWFKNNVRKLRALGLTESLEVGYQLSPRGRTFLEK
jgi:DNA-binding MarR family transcriptional regulator